MEIDGSMASIDPNEIRRLIAPNGTLFIPNSITSAIEKCIVSGIEDIEEKRENLKDTYKYYTAIEKWKPISCGYESTATLDAYSAYYVPRYTLVPKIAMLYLAHCPAFQELPDRLRVLDLGSGTGAVVLGLLDLFKETALHNVALHIRAVDRSERALAWQEKLHDGWNKSQKLTPNQWDLISADLSDPRDYKRKLSNGGLYDLVFCSSLLTELGESAIVALLQHAATLLSDNGVIVIAEAQRDYIKKQMVRIAKTSSELELHIYYPCPAGRGCHKPLGEGCWMWSDDEIQPANIAVGDSYMAVSKELVASWMILYKKPHSIYDALRAQDRNQGLTWGVTGHDPRQDSSNNGTKSECYEICTSGGKERRYCRVPRNRRLWIPGDLIKRGSLIGYTDGCPEFNMWDVIGGLNGCGERQLYNHAQTADCS